ncbi:hypothetical protein POM88_030834 [Heracleum sosnowskyi]|uniref:Uncharacterized protein n=1 Tax=Heracleum sosnowskyi TaxID=360622 RepID=A0AAD8MII9_9APIA|nr:hypothetical protein POM88_030834 [Heracleum sosnowskyi]
MASVYCSINPARVPVSPVTAPIYNNVKVQSTVVTKRAEDLPIQLKGKEMQKEQASKSLTSVSRRNMAMQLAIASLAVITTISPDPAEARVVKPEVKRKIFEKLKMLREKAGLSNPITENEEKTSPPVEEEKQKALTPPPISPFSIPASDSVVEASAS